MAVSEEVKELMKKIVEEKGGKGLSKRENEVRYMLWINKNLMKALKMRALNDDTSVKAIIEISVRIYLKEFN